MNNMKETDSIIMKRKGEARYLRENKHKLQKRISLSDTKRDLLSPETYRYLEWTEGIYDNAKHVQQLKENQDGDGTTRVCSSGSVYDN